MSSGALMGADLGKLRILGSLGRAQTALTKITKFLNLFKLLNLPNDSAPRTTPNTQQKSGAVEPRFGVVLDYKFGLIFDHSSIAGMMPNVTNSSRILHK